MFESLADRIKQDEHQSVNKTEQVVRWLVVAVISVLVFGGLYYAVRMFEG